MPRCSHSTEAPFDMESVPRSLSHPTTLESPTSVNAASSSNHGAICGNENPRGENSLEEQSSSPNHLSNRPDPEQHMASDRVPHRNCRQSRRFTLHRSAADGIASAFAPRSSYVQIDPQSATEGTQLGGRLEPGSQAQSRRHASEHRSYRPRSCTSLLKEKGPRRRLITLITSAVFLIFVLALCKGSPCVPLKFQC